MGPDFGCVMDDRALLDIGRRVNAWGERACGIEQRKSPGKKQPGICSEDGRLAGARQVT